MTKILCFNVNEERIPFIKEWEKNNQVTVDYLPDFLTMQNVDLVKGYDGITVAEVGMFDSNLYPELKKRGINQVGQRTTGYENFDLEQATKNGIIITNVGSYSPESIAEFALLLGLQLIRKVTLLDSYVRDHDFRWIPEIRGQTIRGKTVAILGVGSIGLTVARLYKAFGANVIGYDPYPKTGIEDILTYQDSAEAAIKKADIISLHMPAFKENHHLFNQETFKMMKPSAYLINCGRGGLVNTVDLFEALDNNEIAGAALDVYEDEAPYVPGNFRGKEIEDEVFKKLLTHPKITFYHHCAFYTDVSIRNMTEFALDATLEIIKTGTTKYRVN